MENLLVFKTYPDLEAAEQAATILKEHEIVVEVNEEARILDSNYIGQQFSNPYLLYMQGKDFERANTILEQATVVRLEDIDPDYLLLSFSNEELIEVMEKKDEWGIYNYKLAETLLKQKNIPIPEVNIALEQVERLKEKEKAVSSGLMFLVLGYLSVISGVYASVSYHAAFILFPGFLGLMIGWHLSKSKRTLSNGQRVFYYNNTTRIHGSIMLWTSLGFGLLRFIFLLLTLTNS
jgi:tetratricopeptide (TPR) repeat protein